MGARVSEFLERPLFPYKETPEETARLAQLRPRERVRARKRYALRSRPGVWRTPLGTIAFVSFTTWFVWKDFLMQDAYEEYAAVTGKIWGKEGDEAAGGRAVGDAPPQSGAKQSDK